MSLGVLAPGTALAEEQSAADIAAARAFAIEGLKLAQAGRCAEAIEKLGRAEKLHHSAIVLGRLGECHVAQGRIVDGTEMLRRMLREPLPANPSPALSKAYERAEAALDAAKGKIAAVTISIKVPAGVEPIVTFDGQRVPAAVLGGERPTDPGDHVVEAGAPGYLKASARISVAAGAKQNVALVLERDPDAPAVVAPLPDADAAEPPAGGTRAADAPASQVNATTERDSGSTGVASPPPNHTAAYVAWAVGGVGLGVGAVFGIIALGGKSDLDGSCTANVCSSDQQDKLDSAKRSGNISNVGFAVGAAGALVGTVLFFTVGSSEPREGTEAAPSASRRRTHVASLRPRAWLGAGSVQFATDF